ncbi:MAG: outer membrane lipoprotein-sorting protein [Magnetococcales bacterium]|nr:outer membrane lipoprotein-sorting protein [Magnetococcales bacterium]NGZ05336.1 outer membrane lipoprotein-sorting protein [Magnetococcales bacterium]
MVAICFFSDKGRMRGWGGGFRHWLGGVVTFVVWSFCSAGWAMDAGELLRSVDRKLHAASYESFNRVTFELPNGRQRHVTLYTAHASGRKGLLVVVSPEELRGRAVLKVGDEVWMHMPGELETRKTSLMLSVVGGVFNNADFLLGDFSDEYEATLVGEEASFWKLSLKPRFATAPYVRMELKVDKQSRVPLELIQFDPSGFALKTIHYRDPQSSDGTHLMPMVMETASGLNAGYRSTWRVGRAESREFPADAFTREFLPHAGRLLK